MIPPGAPTPSGPDRFTRLLEAGLIGADDIYKRNASLLRRFEVAADDGVEVTSLEVAAATYEAAGNVLRLTIADSGAEDVLEPGIMVSLVPHFFRVSTDGLVDSLPSSSEITIEFQATKVDASGEPDAAATLTIVARVDSESCLSPDIVNTASILVDDFDQTDPDDTYDIASIGITVQCSDLSLTKAVEGVQCPSKGLSICMRWIQ